MLLTNIAISKWPFIEIEQARKGQQKSQKQGATAIRAYLEQFKQKNRDREAQSDHSEPDSRHDLIEGKLWDLSPATRILFTEEHTTWRI